MGFALLVVALPLAAGAEQGRLPAPEDYPAATPGCRSEQRVETKYTSAFVEFPSTIECRLLVHAVCGRPLQEFRSGARANAVGACDDYAQRADALRGRRVCCDDPDERRDSAP